jgi:catechol 2,3-dioxygenase
VVIPKRLGHIVLKVNNIDKSESFYKEILGLKVTHKVPGSMVFMTSGSLSHEIALFSQGTKHADKKESSTQLVHFAWQLKSFEDLKGFYKTLLENKIPVSGIGDHGISIGVYFPDPEGNEIEVYYELPKSQWPKKDIFAGKFPLGSLTRLNTSSN